MSILSRPPIARAVARLMQPLGRIMFKPDPSVAFPDIPARTRELRIPTSYGDVRAIAYLPEQVDAPIYLNFHASGYIVRYPEQDDGLCRYLAHHAGVVVVNVDYDVAPQHLFPVAPREAHEVFSWVVANGGSLGGDVSRVGVGGQSAGGAISDAIARIALESGGPVPQAVVMLYPPVDVSTEVVWTPGRATKPVLTPGLAEMFTAAYIPDAALRNDPLASPGAAANREAIPALPPTLIVDAELDMLWEHSARYARALRDAGVDIDYWTVPGADHSFIQNGPYDSVVKALDRIVVHLDRTIGPHRRQAPPSTAG